MAKYSKGIQEASKVLAEALHGDYRAQGLMKELVTEGTALNEAISTSDLNAAFVTNINAAVLKQYNDEELMWKRIAKRNVVQDFKPQYFKEFDWDFDLQVDELHGHQVPSGSLARVPELDEYPTFRFSTAEKQFQIYKHGARLPFSWEAVINDEWGFIASIPGELTARALRTEESEVVSSFVDANGPRADVFVAGVNPVKTEFALTLDNLKAAKTEISQRKVNGRNITVNKYALVVPPALEETAKSILAITQYEETVTIGGAERRYTVATGNGDVELVVMPSLAWVDKSNNVANTWYLVPAGGSDGTRDTILQNFLRRHESPELRISGNTGTYLGGGAVPGLEGSLLNDDVQYRVRHVVTGFVLNSAALFAARATA